MKLSCLCFLFTLALLLMSCARVHYIGDSYPATSSVESFYSQKDIPFKYKTIGQAVISGENTSKLSDKLIKKAKEKGADAVLILGFDMNGDSENEGPIRNKEIKASFLKKS